MRASIMQPFNREALLQDLWGPVHQSVEQFADRDFVVTNGGSLTFQEANHRSNVIYQAVAGQGLGRGYGVGLFLIAPHIIAPAIMGVLKANGYVVPLDITFPDSLLQHMIQTAGIKLVLTDDRHVKEAHSLVSSDITVINLSDLDYAIDVPNPEVHYEADDIVQILFTSGSTGQPKGVIEDYRYLARGMYLADMPLNARVGILSSFSFAGAHVYVFRALVAGFANCFYNLRAEGFIGLKPWLLKEQITNLLAMPTVIRSFISALDPEDQFPSVIQLGRGGEKRTPEDIEAIQRHFPNIKKWTVGFSSTETQRICHAAFPVDHVFTGDLLPAGFPLEDIEVLLWDEDGKEVPFGEEGEIVVHGDALAQGYINNPELTREHFIPDPDRPGWQYFRTKDLGKFLPDGQLLHLGRIDNMVKIKGVRVELSSIEKHIMAYPGVVLAAAKAVEDPRGNLKLAAYFVAESGVEVPISDLRKSLADKLPQAMLPHFLVPLSEFPRTPGSGKVAYSQLPPPQMVRPDLSHDYIAPETSLETTLVELWEDVLGITGIGVTDDFFDVGGDSLMGVLLFVKIEEVLERSLPVSILLTANTIRKQADIIQNQGRDSDYSALIPIEVEGENPPLFFIPGRGGYPTRIRHLARSVEPGTPIYALQNLQVLRESGGVKALKSIEAAAAFFISQIKRVALQGPYFLVGESAGGKIAYEMALQLMKEGIQVPILAMLDTYNMPGPIMDYSSIGVIKHRWMLVKKHISILVKSDWQGRREYIQFYRETFGDKVKRVLRRTPNQQRNPNQSALPEHIRQTEVASHVASRSYQLEPYPGKVLLLKAMRGPKAYDPTNGWDRVELGELVIHPLDCYHGSILFEPAVSQVAEILQSYIDEYQETRE